MSAKNLEHLVNHAPETWLENSGKCLNCLNLYTLLELARMKREKRGINES